MSIPFNFTQLSKCTTTTVGDLRERMNKFLKGVSDLVVNKFPSAMLIPYTSISRSMVCAQQINEKNNNKTNREVRKLESMMRTFLMLSLMEKVGLSPNKGIPVKILPTPLSLTKRRVVGLFCLSLLTPSAGGVIIVSV